MFPDVPGSGSHWGHRLTLETTQILNSPSVEQRQRGFAGLGFSPFEEEEFRRYYAESSVLRARLILISAITTTLIVMGMRLADRDASVITLLFHAIILLPALSGALYFSTQPDRHRLYQFLLAASALAVGLLVTSIVTRASLHGDAYYFAVQISWIFIMWLILGLIFRDAAVIALTTSGLYVFGIVNWNMETTQATFESAMLLLVNIIGAVCCYQLEQAVRRSFVRSKELGKLADRDGLTGLYNRRRYDKEIQRIWRQSRREQTQLTILLIDIDYFKAFNDYYGHQAGDDALKAVADVISLFGQRPLDFGARYGGEEFALVLYGPAAEFGREFPEKLREAVLALKIPHEKSPTAQYLTTSIGVAMAAPETSRSLTGIVQMADEALYQAKEDGRNRVVIKESSSAQVQTGRFRAADRVPV